MKIKTFLVSHSKARAPLVIQGTSLKAALKAAGLNPLLWKEIKPLKLDKEAYSGKNNINASGKGN